MDFDDVVKVLIPKSKRKALKRRWKKEGVWGLVRAVWRVFTGNGNNGRKFTSTTPNLAPASKSDMPSDPLLAHLAQARIYGSKIEAMTQATEAGSLEEMRLVQLNERVREWIQAVEVIVSRTLAQKEDALLAAERKQVPAAIKRLEKQLAETDDEMLQQKLAHTLANRRKQLDQLEQMANGRKLAELKVENTLAQLGIIYSQLQSGQYMRQRSGYERLAAEIADEVHGLGDYLDTLDELQQGVSTWH